MFSRRRLLIRIAMVAILLPALGRAAVFSVNQVRGAYGFGNVISRGITGAWQTIAVVEDYNDTYIQNDVNLFDTRGSIMLPENAVFVPEPAGMGLWISFGQLLRRRSSRTMAKYKGATNHDRRATRIDSEERTA